MYFVAVSESAKSGAGDNAKCHCLFDRLSTTGSVQLAVDIRGVPFDGFIRDVELAGNFLVAQTQGKLPENGELTYRKSTLIYKNGSL